MSSQLHSLLDNELKPVNIMESLLEEPVVAISPQQKPSEKPSRKRKTKQELRVEAKKRERLASEQSALLTFPDAKKQARIVYASDKKREQDTRLAISLGCHPIVAHIRSAIQHWTTGDFEFILEEDSFEDDPDYVNISTSFHSDSAIVTALKHAGYHVGVGGGSGLGAVRYLSIKMDLDDISNDDDDHEKNDN